MVKNKKSQIITIRCTEKQKEAILQKAEKSGLSTSNYILNKCIDTRQKKYKTKTQKEALKAGVVMKKCLGNIEDLTKGCPQFDEIEKSILELREQEMVIWRSLL